MCITDRHDMTLAVKVALNSNTTNRLLTTLKKKLIENIEEKEENAGNQHYSFPTLFSILSRTIFGILITFNL